MRWPFFFFLINLLLFNCTQTTFLTGKVDEDSKEDLLNKKVSIHYNDGYREEGFIHNTLDDTIITVTKNNGHNKLVNIIPCSRLRNIQHNDERVGWAGFILGFAPLYFASAGTGFPVNIVLVGSAFLTGGIGWALGRMIPVDKVYTFEPPSVSNIQYGLTAGSALSAINKKWLFESTEMDFQSVYKKNPSTKVGYNIGIVIIHNPTNYIALQYNLGYLKSGARWGGYVLDGDYIDYGFTSITGQALFKGRIYKNFMLCAGLYVERNLQARQKFVIEDLHRPRNLPGIPTNFSDEVNPYIYGVTWGIQTPFFYDEMHLNFLWSYNLNELYKEDWPLYGADFRDKSGFKRKMFTISVDYIFN